MQVALPKGVGGREWRERYDEQRAKRKRESERQREKNCGTTAESGGQRLRLCLALFDYPPPPMPPHCSPIHCSLSHSLPAAAACRQ